MEKFLREWRKDAVDKNQFETAIFVGDKILALTDSDNDAFWLAQVYFSTGNYTRAQSLLSRPDLVARNPQCKYLAAYCHIKQGRFDDALSILGEKNPHHLAPPTGTTRRKLQHRDDALLNGAGKRGKAVQRNDRGKGNEERDVQDNTTVRFEAAMCYLRGICYAKQNAFDRAKECYKDAVRIDVQCFEAFDQLMKNALMSPDEEWMFLDSLNFDSISAGDNSTSQQAAELTKMLYITRLSKYKNPGEFTQATETLSSHYNLASNPDILLSRAELLFTQCRFKEALILTEAILQQDQYNFSSLPVHLACLHELSEKNALFLLAHKLADHHPEEPATWLAVGVYYLTISKLAEARRFFSKSSLMDPHFGPAWIGFAHTFAAEGEHDQAISAYSTAARLFQGTHLPQLFLGMQNLQLQNFALAKEYLDAAYRLCQTDPLLLNELGVVFYMSNHLEEAASVFTTALELTLSTELTDDEPSSDPRGAWLATRANLGHTFRRMRRWSEALAAFDAVLRQGSGRDVGVLCSKALVLLELGAPWEATVCLHEALSVSPQDAIATELLSKALEETSLDDFGGGMSAGGGRVEVAGEEVEEEFEDMLAGRRMARWEARRAPSQQTSLYDSQLGDSLAEDVDLDEENLMDIADEG